MARSERRPESAPRVSPFCSDLQSKQLLVRGAPPLDDADVLDASNHAWCLRTQTVLGPDAGRVTPARCRAGRGCFRSPFERLT